MPDERPVQLSFDVGGASPDVATIRISGGFGLSRELRKGEIVGVRLISEDGEILAEADGPVVGIAFKDKINKKHGFVESTERAHTVKVN